MPVCLPLGRERAAGGAERGGDMSAGAAGRPLPPGGFVQRRPAVSRPSKVMSKAWSAAFVLAIAMGLRRGEIIGLRWSDLDLESRVLYVRQQTQRRRGVLYDDDPKSRRRRVVPLPALCIAPLRWHRMLQSAARAKAGEQWQESGYVFTTRTGRQVEPRNVYRSFTRVAESAGLRVIRLHDARHGTATLLTAAGVAPRVVMEILGHSQISITMDVYTHVVQDTQREAISHMDRLLKRRPVVSDRPR